jgi:hypothetical protein
MNYLTGEKIKVAKKTFFSAIRQGINQLFF